MSGREDLDPFGAGKEPGEQQGVEWLMERCGFVTASRFGAVLDYTKAGKPGAKRTAYLWEKVIERLTGQPAQHYESAAMQWGTSQEAYSRMAYERRTGAFMTQTGFRKHPTIAFVGGSPDGILEPDGGWESKSPFNSANHLQCFLDGMPAEHTPQVQGLIWLEKANWWDFQSFDPRMPEPLDIYIQRIPRDQPYIDTLEAEIVKFLAEVADLTARIQSAAGKGA